MENDTAKKRDFVHNHKGQYSDNFPAKSLGGRYAQ